MIRVSSARTRFPILTHARVTRAANVLTTTSTDLDQWLTFTRRSEGPDFDTCVPAASLAKVLTPASVLQLVGDKLTVANGASATTLDTLPASDFPSPPNQVCTVASGLGLGEAFLDALPFVAPSISREETRFYLMGAHLRSTPGGTDIVATNGHTLRRVASPVASQDLAAIVPGYACKTLLALSKAHPLSHFEIHKTHLEAHLGPYQYRTKLVDASYPAYARVVPDTAETTLTVDTKRLAAGLKELTWDNKSRSTQLALTPGSVTLSSTGATGTASTVALAAWNGEPGLTIGFNGGYLKELCQSFKGRVTFHIRDSGSPVLITGDDPTRVAVIMPLRVPRHG